jgi:ribosomal protein L20
MHKRLTYTNRRERIANIRLTTTHRLNLRAHQHHASLERFLDEIVTGSFLILRQWLIMILLTRAELA